MTKLLIVFLLMLAGCKTLSQPGVENHSAPSLEQAESYLRAGELYRARKMTQQILDQDPENMDAQGLMAVVLEAEISQHKSVFAEEVREEQLPDEKKAQIKTWLERSQAYLQIGQYDKALLAAEKVFLYDAYNVRASNLIDEINDEALKAGKHESFIHSQMVQEEVDIRIRRYREEAELRIEQKRWGAANLLVQKILILSPEDPVGLRLQEELKAQKV